MIYQMGHPIQNGIGAFLATGYRGNSLVVGIGTRMPPAITFRQYHNDSRDGSLRQQPFDGAIDYRPARQGQVLFGNIRPHAGTDAGSRDDGPIFHCALSLFSGSTW